MPPAARLTDLQAAPPPDPAPVPLPTGGGPVIGPGEPGVLIGVLPAAQIGAPLISVGPSDGLVKAMAAPEIPNPPAFRQGDTTVHGNVPLLETATGQIIE